MKYKFSVMYAIFGILLILTMSATHEWTHEIIFKTYGIEASSYLFYTTWEGDCNENCISDNNFNEVVHYQMIPFALMIYLGILFMIILMEKRNVTLQWQTKKERFK